MITITKPIKPSRIRKLNQIVNTNCNGPNNQINSLSNYPNLTKSNTEKCKNEKKMNYSKDPKRTGAKAFQKSKSVLGVSAILVPHETSIIKDPMANERVDVSHG
jgi:hypothetical protein